MSASIIVLFPSAHGFPTSESQHVMERRISHVFAAGLMVSEGGTKKMADLENSVLANFSTLVDADEDSTPLMKAAMKKAQGGSTNDMKGSSVWRKYKQVKALIANQMMPFWEFKSGDNESDALNRVRKEVWAFFERKKMEEAAKKKKAKKWRQPATDDSGKVEDDNKDVEEWFEIDPEDCPELWFCAELFTFKMFRADPLLQRTSGSEESSGLEETDIELVTRKVNSRRQQRQMLLTKSLEDKQQEKEMHETAVKVSFAYKEKKEEQK